MAARSKEARLCRGAVLLLVILAAGRSSADVHRRERSGGETVSAAPVTPERHATRARWAILIGVGECLDKERLPALSSPAVPDIPAKDVADLAEALRDSGYRVTCLTEEEPIGTRKPLRSNILDVLGALRDPERYPIREVDTVLVYFSAHAFVDPKEGKTAYLAAADTFADNAEETGIRTADIPSLLAKCPARSKILVLDTGHSGMAAQGLPEGMVLLGACASRESCYILEKGAGEPDGVNSTYTYYLVKGLRGQADLNRDGEITCTELHRFAHKQVTDWSRRVHGSQTDSDPERSRPRGQTPVFASVMTEDVVIAGKPGPGTLAVDSKPWAEISLDGHPRGRTPAVLSDVPAGRHVLTFRSPRHPAAVTKVLDMAPGGDVALSVEFPSPGHALPVVRVIGVAPRAGVVTFGGK